LRYSVEVEPGLSSLPFPSVLLMTLVGNAIKHGIEPMKEGGDDPRSRPRGADRLLAVVADTGMRVWRRSADGVGLDNIRERLQCATAPPRRCLAANEPRGFVARLEMPCPT
jgi:LytS/YehU family sensor histidine kinase